MIVYGRNVVEEVIKAGHPIRELILTPETQTFLADLIEKHGKKRFKIKIANNNEISKIAEGGVHQGALANIEDIKSSTLEDILVEPSRNDIIVVLDELQDPRNFGAIARTSLAAGVKGILMSGRRSSPLSAVALKASAGAFFRLKVAYMNSLAQVLEGLKAKDYWVYGADIDAEKSLFEVDFAKNVALVFGGEGKGMRHLVKSKCDVLFKIPMFGPTESLNVSVACGIALYEVIRS